MQTAAVLFLHLFYRTNPSAKVSQLGEFLLNCLQPLVPLAVSNLRLDFISARTSILIVQLLNLSDLGAETSDFFTKNCEMIHNISIASSPIACRLPVRQKEWRRNKPAGSMSAWAIFRQSP